MKKVWLSECFISLLLSILLLSCGVNAENNPKISTNSTAYAKDIISRLKTIPCENLTEAIKDYNNKFHSNIFGEIIIITGILKDTFTHDEYSNIIASVAQAFCLYVKNLENPDNDEFNQNEKTLKKLKTSYINTLCNLVDKTNTTPTSTENVFWNF